MRVLNVYPEIQHTDPAGQTKADFTSDQDPRWCPGCGDYAILAQVQRTLPQFAIPRENYVFVSGIGCASRFPYYMKTYGLHGIHGRAPAIATGIKAARPDLSVWVVMGDGDGLSIGAGQLVHAIRRNVDIKILMFNNRIYGLTKGQYSPTSPVGIKTKSTPMGSIDHPLDPASVVLGAGGTFVARAVDVNAKLLQNVIERAAAHKGAVFVEILQNCPIFNDGAFAQLADKTTRAEHELVLEHGRPMRFGKAGEKGILLGGDLRPQVVEVAAVGEDKLLVHDEKNPLCAQVLAHMHSLPGFPTPLGVLAAVERPSYESQLEAQVAEAMAQVGPAGASLQALIDQGHWVVQ